MSRFIKSAPFQPALLSEEGHGLQFALQQHIAHLLHFDFRFEFGKELADFAIDENGPSSEPGKRVKAARMHDHSRSILNCEGVMRLGNDYAGQMIMSDRGILIPVSTTDEPYDNIAARGLESGYLEVDIFGQRMRGRYVLQKEDKDWSIRKVSDSWDNCFTTEDLQISVVSGRRILELDGTPEWLEAYLKFRKR